MPQMIKYGDELIRISPKDNKKIEFSRNNGMTWITRCNNNSTGGFLDLMDNGTELLATTQKGLYFSRNKGLSWILRKR